ncbi:MAG: CRTAC1 family protein, partial [Chitinophagaceae bacterium]|nr:CRTAC1 family protein [Chitinophagaceae bacterium]
MKIYVFILALLYIACHEPAKNSNEEMAALLKKTKELNAIPENIYSSNVRVAYFDSLYRAEKDVQKSMQIELQLIRACLENGDENLAIGYGNDILKKIADSISPNKLRTKVMKEMAIAWLRVAEKTNCIGDHNGESCVFPIQGGGVHRNKAPAEKAIALYEEVLKDAPNDITAKWLLNIAYMTVDGYPSKVPGKYLIPGLNTDTVPGVKPFVDGAVKTGLDITTSSGGVIVDDFNNDGYYDIITCSEILDEPMRYFINNGNGTFSDASAFSGLNLITGGLNLMQTDYNNDGFKDVFVTRRGWPTTKATEPNSLLRNNGDGTFTDVTKESGLLIPYQTQSAAWADYNNDGWIDVYIANEADHMQNIPCELFINNKNGTFTDVAKRTNSQIFAFVKGATCADYNNDGLMDIFLSSQEGRKVLLKNTGIKDGLPYFKDVTKEAGITNGDGTSTTWFWDYDNDGWQDIFIASKKFFESPTYYFAKEAMGETLPGYDAKMFLYRNLGNGKFEEVSAKVGLNKVAIAMGANFGDIDNDGFLDFYLGTGNLDFSVLVPNKLFRNNEGKSFTDVTTSARVGNLQKGHGIAFADLDNDGDQDIYIDMGGAYKGDAYQSALYLNPGQNENRWIKLDLVGTKANKAAIGANIKVYFRENGKERMVNRDFNSGGSFGANPLMQHIGIGKASIVDKVVIKWPGTNSEQVFNNLQPGQLYTITEGNNVPVIKNNLKRLDFMDKNRTTIGCAPLA